MYIFVEVPALREFSGVLKVSYYPECTVLILGVNLKAYDFSKNIGFQYISKMKLSIELNGIEYLDFFFQTADRKYYYLR